jgi:hypothetical protein
VLNAASTNLLRRLLLTGETEDCNFDFKAALLYRLLSLKASPAAFDFDFINALLFKTQIRRLKYFNGVDWVATKATVYVGRFRPKKMYCFSDGVWQEVKIN